jgi:hypothetical protein
LNDNLDNVKETLKKRDAKRQGALSESDMIDVLRKFSIKIRALDKFKRGDGEVDYIKFLKYYL